MKLIFKDYQIELTYKEFQKLFPLKQRIKGSGRKSKLNSKYLGNLKKVLGMYPERSNRSLATEFNTTIDTIKYWRHKIKDGLK